MYDFEMEKKPENKTDFSSPNNKATLQKKTSAVNYLKSAPVQKKAENNTGLPDNLKSGIESMSGFSMDDVNVHYNSSKPAQMKALAYTQGSDIHIAPGQEQHLGHEAWHVVQQKQGRVEPTAQMKGMNVNDSPALEHEADVMGAKAVQFKNENISNTQSIQMKHNDNAPIQFWGLGEHKKITKKAFKMSRNNNNIPKDEKKAIKTGAVFNDVHGSELTFGARYIFHTDEFLNESHHGGMQFLHTMSNDEDAFTNYNKQLAWAEFCIDTRTKNQDFQNKNILEYLRENEDALIFEMLMPAMIDRSKYKHFKKEFPDLATFTPKEISMYINHYLIMNPEAVSPWAKQTIGDFFRSGKKENNRLDSGLIATGSLSHMIEDSFANSHAQRIVNLNQNASKTENAQQLLENGNSTDILKTLTPVMLHANYNEQQSVLVWGKHSKGDNFDGELDDSQGATQAQLVVAYVMKSLDEINALQSNGKDTQEKVKDLKDFLKEALKVDKNALALQKIEKIKKDGGNQSDINEALRGTDLEGLNINFMNNDVSTTKAGRQYEKTRRSFGHSSFINGNGWMVKEENKIAKNALKKYDKLLKEEQTNTVYKKDKKIEQYQEQTYELLKAITNSQSKNDEVKNNIKKHATEILLNVIYIEKDITNDASQNSILSLIKSALVNIINK